ncbi:class I SAM-dependent methyltransferase [Bacillus sp. BRMEA1]|uniref:class I SAM-dependent methyltransferase n=1 Tax=Neobacillus endophyticus TaxID=2738405 RepID=UPI001563EC6B|nr:class I SAM-dependent methyltransferase [Neobacillus endophyticus]NRD77717.1 class I SAM-dependent methyltransferase [Neobacillus endophyticus]
MKQTDIGQVAYSYARSREDIPSALMDSLQLRNIFWEGKKVADIGSGTGALTRKIAMRRADVAGVEPTLEMLAQAEMLNRSRNFTIPYHQGTAEDTGLQTSHYDMVTVLRAWHWFEREKAICEIKRILKPKGTLIVIDSGFTSGATAVQKTMTVLESFVPDGLKPAGSKADAVQQINGFPVEWFEEWQRSGFELRDFYKINYTVNFTKLEWLECVETSSWLAGLGETEQNLALKALSDSLTDDEPYMIPHDCNVCILRLTE